MQLPVSLQFVCGSSLLHVYMDFGICFLFSIIQSIYIYNIYIVFYTRSRAVHFLNDHNNGLSSILSGHLRIYNMIRNNTHITFNEIDLDSIFFSTFPSASSLTFSSHASYEIKPILAFGYIVCAMHLIVFKIGFLLWKHETHH